MERRLYLGLAVLALLGTQATLAWHFLSGRSAISFLTDTVSTPASTFAVVDLVCVAAAALVFVVCEGRRIGIRRVWAYVVLTFVIAVSVAFPLFLAIRNNHQEKP